MKADTEKILSFAKRLLYQCFNIRKVTIFIFIFSPTMQLCMYQWLQNVNIGKSQCAVKGELLLRIPGQITIAK